MRNLVLICALALPTLAQSLTPQSAGAALPVVTITRAGVLALDGRPVNIRQLNASLERRSNAERESHERRAGIQSIRTNTNLALRPNQRAEHFPCKQFNLVEHEPHAFCS